jgi:hypothetical protein
MLDDLKVDRIATWLTVAHQATELRAMLDDRLKNGAESLTISSIVSYCLNKALEAAI